MKNEILIVTITNDIHALAVQKYITDNFNVAVRLLCVDHLTSGFVKESFDGDPILTDANGEAFTLKQIALIWWRRTKGTQLKLDAQCGEDERDLINNDWSTFLKGTLQTHFNGKWISDPQHTEMVGNKIFQLNQAQKFGFLIPDTLISNDPDQVMGFVKSYEKVIVKPIQGTKKKLLFTQFVNRGMLTPESIAMVPAIYQQYIEGTVHLRVNIFGENVYAASIETEDLDWRANLHVPVAEYFLPEKDKDQLSGFVRTLGLKMGIVDLKLLPSGQMVWLEINPQGQFLFLEGLSKQNLLNRFSEFLVDECVLEPAPHL